MVKSVENGMSLPPFLVKCYEMVNDESTNDLISWSESGDSFIIWDESKFSSQLLPKYFKHSNFSSFVRQLNIYGFKKIDTDNWQFANEAFIKGQKHLLKNIIRRKHSQPTQKKPPQQKDPEPAPPSQEDKRMALWKEVESLKTGKNALTQELIKVSQHQQTSRNKLLLLSEQLKGMEKNQQQMLSFIVMAMQSPEIITQFFQPKENTWRMAETGTSKLSEVTDDCDSTPNGTIVPYQPPKDGVFEAAEANHDEFMEFDCSSDEIKGLLMDVDLLLSPSSVDGNVFSFENDGKFVIPDATENDAEVLDQMLWAYPSTENEVRDDVEGEEEYWNPSSGDTSENVEVLARQMGSLASEMS